MFMLLRHVPVEDPTTQSFKLFFLRLAMEGCDVAWGFCKF